MMPDGGHPGFIESFGYAFRGVAAAVKAERNIKVMLALGAAAVAAGFVLRIDAPSWVAVIVMIAAVIAGELFNTAVEAVVDLVSPGYDELAGKAKDLAAGAQLVLCIGVGVAGLVIYVRAALVLLGWGA